MHHAYLLRCADGTLYAGTCVDPVEREATHNAGKGSKYVRSRLPARIVHLESFGTLSEARKREAELKKLTKAQKEALLTKTARSSRAA